jgi:release factor glutamine methyltransferase
MQPTESSPSKIRALVAEGEYQLAQGPHPERARLDSEMLLLHLFRRNDPERNRAWLLAHWNNPTMPTIGAEHRALVKRRLQGEPIQYITGEQEFYGLSFRVNRNVLIPRPETEGLVERTLELVAQFAQPRIVDVGTGSGAIAVALAAHCKDASVTAIDISAAALEVARGNAERNQVAARIRFVQGDLLAGIARQSAEFVVSNPPYVPEADRATLAVEVREHEPQQALFAGSDGLSIYRRLIPEAQAVLVAGGWLLLEIGYGQAEALRTLLSEAGFTSIEFVRDLQGIERVAVARKP